MRRWLNANFASAYFEPQYKDIPPRIVVEPLLLTAAGSVPEDYKFYVFHGSVRMIHVDTGRFTGHKRSLFDPVWRRLKVESKFPSAGDLKPPARLQEMMAAAEELGRDFEFVRVDLYCVDGKMFCGEITHTPDGGLARFKPADFDLVLGRLWGEGGPIPAKYYA